MLACCQIEGLSPDPKHEVCITYHKEPNSQFCSEQPQTAGLGNLKKCRCMFDEPRLGVCDIRAGICNRMFAYTGPAGPGTIVIVTQLQGT